MSTALSGLRNHQVMLDVVGNDIANVSTVGFKSSTTVFSDVLTQTLQGAGAPQPGLQGGTNPAQIGLGSRLMATVQSFTQGSLQRTGRSTDLAIQGDGFFQVRTANETMYTRGGALTLDSDGNLTTAEGFFVQGWQADVTGAINTNLDTGPIQIRVGDNLNPNQSQNVVLGGNLSADAAIGTATTLTLVGYDEQGTTTPINLTYTKTAANTWTVTGTYGPGNTAFALTDNVLTFDGGGELIGPADHNINIAGGVIPGYPNPIVLDLGAAGSPGRVTQFAGAASIAITNQDGFAAGSLQSFSVGQDGVISGTYSNGRTKAIGQLALAVFNNPQGLERVAGAWRPTVNSGEPQVGVAGTGGKGLLSAGTLEMSNVDLAEEFTRLIVAQRGFQGNARVITTSDEVLQEVVNLRR
ncbi:MAG: flagellar hook protein FlgE [Acidimicrobiales bacterium]|nr:flagellar hook protein FlgE [Acidimicrobiales bacterium]